MFFNSTSLVAFTQSLEISFWQTTILAKMFDGIVPHLIYVLLALFLSLAAPLCTAAPIASPETQEHTALLLPATPFFYFPAGSSVENIRVRVSGQILVTLSTVPELYQIDPFGNQTGGIVRSFGGYTSLFGIAELETDVFYIIASNFSGAPDNYGFQGTVSIFEVDLRGIADPTTSESAVKICEIVDVPQAQLLDGFDVLNKSAGLLVTGDAQTGTLYLIDVHQRTATPVLQNELLEPTTNARAAGLAHIGINGLKVYKGHLYFTNTAKGTYAEVPLSLVTGKPEGSPSVIANYSTLTDDLSFDNGGNVFISEELVGVVLRPANTTALNNHTRVFSPLVGANANSFGRTAMDVCTLYSIFDGPVPGVARIDAGKESFCG